MLHRISLAVFAIVLAQVDAPFAGRAFAAYGGVYVVASLTWAAIIEHRRARLRYGVFVGLSSPLAVHWRPRSSADFGGGTFGTA